MVKREARISWTAGRVVEDYSPKVLNQRAEYRDIMAELYKLGLKPALIYPAQLCLRLSGGARMWISSVEEAHLVN